MDHLRLTEALQRVLSAPHYAHIRDLARNLATDLAPLLAEAESEEIARLRDLLETHGHHDQLCPGSGRCTCGWAEAWRTIE